MSSAAPGIPQQARIIRDFEKGRLPLVSDSTRFEWEYLMKTLEDHHAAIAKKAKIGSAKMTDIDKQIVAKEQAWISDHNFGGIVPHQSPDIKVEAEPGEWITLMGEIYYILWKKYKEGARKQWVKDVMLRVRTLAGGEVGQLPTSKVTLSFDVNTNFGTGLTAPSVTMIPDPNLGVEFGSTPDHVQIESQAPEWQLLRRRWIEDKSGKLQKKGPHYVLAHMLNDNLNGSGADAHNVMPFWTSGNKEMAKRVENKVKEFVLRGFEVEYKIVSGPEYGKAHRQATLDAIVAKAGVKDATMLIGDAKDQYKIVEMEAGLAQYLVISARVKQQDGNWLVIANDVRIDNYVPATIPTLIGS